MKHLEQLRVVARSMRQAGRTNASIASELGVAPSTIGVWLDGIARPPVPRVHGPFPERPSTAAGRRELARKLWEQGCDAAQVSEALGMSVGTVRRYVAGMTGARERLGRHAGRRWRGHHEERAEQRQVERSTGRSLVAALGERELVALGAVAYWCEGAKSKSYDLRERLVFVNSDPDLIRLFLRWLDLMGHPRDFLRFSLSIHESADLEGAQRYWCDVLELDPSAFGRPSLKRHNPEGARLGAEGHAGCLVVRVRRSRDLYNRMEGMWEAIADSVRPGSLDAQRATMAAPSAVG